MVLSSQLIKPATEIIKPQMIDRRGFIRRLAAAGVGIVVPQMPLIPAWGQVTLGCVTSSPYVTRPPWKVAGVDYCVGIGSGVILKDASTIGPTTIPGVSAFGTNPGDATLGQIFVQANNPAQNVVIDGYHFHNVSIRDDGANCNSLTFRNCFFEWDPRFDNGNGTSIGMQIVIGRIPHLTVEHCEFGHMVNAEGTIDYASGENATAPAYNGSFTMRWNFFNNCPGDGLNQKSGGDSDIRYNVFLNQGGGGEQGHSDQLTLEQGAGRHFRNTLISFNTVFDDSFFACGNGGQGFTLQGNDHCDARIICDGGSVDHNTWVNVTTGCPGDVLAGVFYGPCVDISDVSNGKQWRIENNYVDDIGFTRVGTTNLEWLRVQNFFATPLGGTCFSGNNIDLRTNTTPPRNNRGLQTPANLANDGQVDSC